MVEQIGGSGSSGAEQARKLAEDLDGNRRVDILDLARAGAALGSSAEKTLYNQAKFNDPKIETDPLRGPYLKLGGEYGFPIDMGSPGNPVYYVEPARDSYYVITDAHGKPVLEGKVDTSINGEWTVNLLKSDIPRDLLRSESFGVTVYLKDFTDTWSHSHRSFAWPTHDWS
jgi:hypothetical protein